MSQSNIQPSSSLRAKDMENLLVRDPDLRIIRDHDVVLRYREYFRQGGMKVVLVGGVYDMFHEGHAKYLLKCLGKGDILIVALDDDALTRKRKNNPHKPFDSEMDRARILCYACMAHMITFRGVDEHPHDLVKILCPDVLVTSETTIDINNKDREILSEYCEEVVVFPAQSSTTTTAKFKRFAESFGVETAQKLLGAINDIFKPLGINFSISTIGENNE